MNVPALKGSRAVPIVCPLVVKDAVPLEGPISAPTVGVK